MALDSTFWNKLGEVVDSGDSFKTVKTDRGLVTISGTPDFVEAVTVLKSGERIMPDAETGQPVSNWEALEELGYFK